LFTGDVLDKPSYVRIHGSVDPYLPDCRKNHARYEILHLLIPFGSVQNAIVISEKTLRSFPSQSGGMLQDSSGVLQS